MYNKCVNIADKNWSLISTSTLSTKQHTWNIQNPSFIIHKDENCLQIFKYMYSAYNLAVY